MSKDRKDKNAPSKDECKTRALEAGAGEEGAQRCDQSGTVGTAKPEEQKSKKQQERMVQNVFGMDESEDFGEEEQ